MQVKRIFTVGWILILAMTGTFRLYGNDWAFTGVTPDGHKGAVTAIIHNGNSVISAGEDGFLEIWDVGGGRAVERFQVSLYRITAMAHRPGVPEVSIVENDGLGRFRISAWNYRERRNIFTLQFRDPIRYVNYSAAGNYIIAGRTGRTALVFINSVTGDIIPTPASLIGTTTLAVNGRNERFVVLYLTSGRLSIWDLASGQEASGFSVPAGLSSAIIFGNSRFLAGVNQDGLSVVNTANGVVLATNDTIPANSLLFPSGDNFYCLIYHDDNSELRRYTIDNSGRLVIQDSFTIPNPESESRYTVMAFNGTAILGTSDGKVLHASMGRVRTFTVNTVEKPKIIDTAVSGNVIAFIGNNSTLGFIPNDFNLLSDGETLSTEQNTRDFNRISSFSSPEVIESGQFIFWHDGNNRILPLLRSSDPEISLPALGITTLRSPMHSVSSYDGNVMFLDTSGNITVVFLINRRARPFTFSSMSIMDADFIDSNRLLLGRTAAAGGSPFLLLNINTGETVRVFYPASVGLAVRRGASNKIYAAILSDRPDTQSRGDMVFTSIIELNMANSADSAVKTVFQGEATQVTIAESQGVLAAAAGGESAIAGSALKPDRTPGIPLRFVDNGTNFISLDREGNIAWHQSDNGKLLAVFSLAPDGWTLRTQRRTVNGGF